MELIGTWFNSQGYTLYIESTDNHTVTGEFGIDTHMGQKWIPIEGVITSNGQHAHSLLFSIHWNRHLASVDGYTHFCIQLTSESNGIAIDVHWFRHPDRPKRKQLEKGTWRFSKFDFQELPSN